MLDKWKEFLEEEKDRQLKQEIHENTCSKCVLLMNLYIMIWEENYKGKPNKQIPQTKGKCKCGNHWELTFI